MGAQFGSKRQWGIAWMGLCLALAAHVLGETLTSSLSLWNPTVQSLRDRMPLVPLPTFTLEIWFGGLVLAVLTLLLLSWFVFRGARWMLPLSYLFAVVMLGNGVLHIAASLALGRAALGVYSSPLLLGAGAYLLACTHRHRQLTRGE